ncbi:MarR family transcriptional regulator [Parasulfuritortus cantonensis]|uniref:MarR family transcriptional regulator n=1 Tax=Parasulfuritortus cantonensis TaxID=2528202 RepID=A0A4R1BD38_9PROT|nr:MarR family transcriptional regulator [Parasulfuritortus cantonensis]TCJ14963.1 MarR family transcriptional regulator [Parasulfuritortus cantonensis]
MTDLSDTTPEREQALNQALEALFYAFNALVAHPDAMLAEQNLSRVHHRILYFVGRNPGVSVNDLLGILGVTKQSLNAPMRRLAELGYVRADTDAADRRVRRLSLTPAGQALESVLSGDQRARFARVFARLGAADEAGWRRVMAGLAEDEGLT